MGAGRGVPLRPVRIHCELGDTDSVAELKSFSRYDNVEVETRQRELGSRGRRKEEDLYFCSDSVWSLVTSSALFESGRGGPAGGPWFSKWVPWPAASASWDYWKCRFSGPTPHLPTQNHQGVLC